MKSTCLCLGALTLSLVSCKREEVKVYQVAKEPANPTQPATKADPHAGMPGMTPRAPGADPHAGFTAEQLAAMSAEISSDTAFADTPPAGWKKSALGLMRLASYQVTGEAGASADISFYTLRRAAGSPHASINRWRGQMSQSPIAEAALKDNSQTVTTSFGDAVLVDIEGLPTGDVLTDGRLIGAIAEQGDSAWLFKMRGNASLVAAEKEHFIQWMQTVKPASK